MIVSRPIKHTVHVAEFRRLLEALGGRTVVDSPASTVVALPSGLVELRTPDSLNPSGTVSLGFGVDDLVPLIDAAAAHGIATRLEQTDGNSGRGCRLPTAPLSE